MKVKRTMLWIFASVIVNFALSASNFVFAAAETSSVNPGVAQWGFLAAAIATGVQLVKLGDEYNKAIKNA